MKRIRIKGKFLKDKVQAQRITLILFRSNPMDKNKKNCNKKLNKMEIKKDKII